MTSDPLDILQLSRPFDLPQLERAYKKVARRLHPDAGGTKEQFQELEKAYATLKAEILSFPEKIRKAFSQLCSTCPSNNILHEMKVKLIKDQNGIREQKRSSYHNLADLKKHLEKVKQDPSQPFYDILIEEYDLRIQREEFTQTQIKELEEITNELGKLLKITEQEFSYSSHHADLQQQIQQMFNR